MATQIADAFPATLELKTHIHLVGDPAALDLAWEQDGYWLFRDVLDKRAVARLRQALIDELEAQKAIDPGNYVRNTVWQKLIGSEIPEFYNPGSEVIIAYDDDPASVVRPPH